MCLGALIDAGVPLDAVREALGALAVEPDMVWTERVMRAGISATRLCVRGEDESHHAHDHHGHSHGPDVAAGTMTVGHRSLSEIRGLIAGSALSAAGKECATSLFMRLGEAEASVHGVSLEQVHFHEVGTLDSIVDVVGTVFAVEALKVDRIVASPLNVGGGMVRTSHGLYPVPAPATVRLLEGAPIYARSDAGELVTPTGALLVTGLADAFGPVPAMRLDGVGYGAGARNPHDTPNVLRVLIGQAEAGTELDAVAVIEAEIDDMNPQIFGTLMEQLLEAGALDVYYTPIQMKKNRPGTLLTVLARPGDRESLTSAIFRETTTIGVRHHMVMREGLARAHVSVETELGPVRIKMANRGGQLMNASPEFSDCVRIATATGRALKDVQALAMRAFLDRPREAS